MLVQCRIEGIEEITPMSHSEFLFRTVIYSVIRIADGRLFRVKMPKRLSLQLGQLVSLDEAVLEAGLI